MQPFLFQSSGSRNSRCWQDTITIAFLHLFIFCVCDTHMWRSEDNLYAQFFSSTMWVPRIEFRLSGLVAGTFTHCTSPCLSPGLFYLVPWLVGGCCLYVHMTSVCEREQMYNLSGSLCEGTDLMTSPNPGYFIVALPTLHWGLGLQCMVLGKEPAKIPKNQD